MYIYKGAQVKCELQHPGRSIITPLPGSFFWPPLSHCAVIPEKKFGIILKHVISTYIRNKVKLSHYRPGQTLRLPGDWGPQISRQLAHEGGTVVSPTHQLSLPPPPRKYSWYSFLLEAKLTPGNHSAARRIMSMKNFNDASGIEPASFWLVVQCLNQMCHRVPQIIYMYVYNLHKSGNA
jgi:hypothetical protein